MIQEDYRAAIDVGTTKVVTVIGRQRPDGSVEIAGMGVTPCNGLSKGMVDDGVATTRSIKESIRLASNEAGVTIKSAYVGLSGSHIESHNRWDQVQANPTTSVITQEVLDASVATVRELAIETEGQLLHVIPRGYTLDKRHTVRAPLGMHARELLAHTHVVKGDKNRIERLRSAAEAAGIKVADMIVEPIASAEAALTMNEREEGVVLLDIGGGTTDIAVFVGGQIVHSAVLPVGGWQFTNDLVIAFMTSFEEAIPLFEEALQHEPGHLQALLGLAWCYKRIDRIHRAIDSLEMAKEHHPEESIVIYNLACYYTLLGDKPKAIECLGRSLRMEPQLRQLIDEETDFDGLRSDPDFQFVTNP